MKLQDGTTLTQVLNALLVLIVMVLVMNPLMNITHTLMDSPVKALLFYLLTLLKMRSE